MAEVFEVYPGVLQATGQPVVMFSVHGELAALLSPDEADRLAAALADNAQRARLQKGMDAASDMLLDQIAAGRA